MSEHHVLRFASDLSARLAARSRHVCVLLGAGSSRACGLPDVRGLEALVAEHLKEPAGSDSKINSRAETWSRC